MNKNRARFEATSSRNAIRPAEPSSPMFLAERKGTTARKRHKTLPDPRALRIGQAGIAWERLKRVIRNHCQHPGHAPLAFQMYGGTIEFRSADEGPVVTLIREDATILLRMNGMEETIRMVRLKTKGVGFEFRGNRYTATRTVIEIVHDGRQIQSGAFVPDASVRNSAKAKKQRRKATT